MYKVSPHDLPTGRPIAQERQNPTNTDKIIRVKSCFWENHFVNSTFHRHILQLYDVFFYQARGLSTNLLTQQLKMTFFCKV